MTEVAFVGFTIPCTLSGTVFYDQREGIWLLITGGTSDRVLRIGDSVLNVMYVSIFVNELMGNPQWTPFAFPMKNDRGMGHKMLSGTAKRTCDVLGTMNRGVLMRTKIVPVQEHSIAYHAIKTFFQMVFLEVTRGPENLDTCPAEEVFFPVMIVKIISILKLKLATITTIMQV
jgi:hypothetical protein